LRDGKCSISPGPRRISLLMRSLGNLRPTPVSPRADPEPGPSPRAVSRGWACALPSSPSRPTDTDRSSRPRNRQRATLGDPIRRPLIWRACWHCPAKRS